jgi:hypothetical protein
MSHSRRAGVILLALALAMPTAGAEAASQPTQRTIVVRSQSSWSGLTRLGALGSVSPGERPERRGHSRYDGVLSDRYYDLLALCETGGNWKHSTRSYTGGLGIHRGTWQRWSNSSSARGKTPREQVAVADNVAFLGFTEPDGEFVWPVGPWGWGCVKNRKILQGFICRSTHKAVKRWKRGC